MIPSPLVTQSTDAIESFGAYVPKTPLILEQLELSLSITRFFSIKESVSDIMWPPKMTYTNI